MDARRGCRLRVWQGGLTQDHTRLSLARERRISLLLLNQRPRRLPEVIGHETLRLGVDSLKRDRKGQHSIRINDRWRVCLAWTGSDAREVEIVDYH